jgi:hypothetical protein
MCVFGREASPKAGVVEEGRDIAAEHDFHAQNAESAGSDITGAFSRENPCSSYIGGGDVPFATMSTSARMCTTHGRVMCTT